MPNCSESFRSGRSARCAVCDGKFGLVRHYSWRTPLCSRKCVDRFTARKAAASVGKIAVLQRQYDQSVEMYEAAIRQLSKHEDSDALVNGDAEVMICWQEDGIWCRALTALG